MKKLRLATCALLIAGMIQVTSQTQASDSWYGGLTQSASDYMSQLDSKSLATLGALTAALGYGYYSYQGTQRVANAMTPIFDTLKTQLTKATQKISGTEFLYKDEAKATLKKALEQATQESEKMQEQALEKAITDIKSIAEINGLSKSDRKHWFEKLVITAKENGVRFYTRAHNVLSHNLKSELEWAEIDNLLGAVIPYK